MVIASSIFYAKNKYLNFEIGLPCAIGGIIGAYFGSKIINKIPDWILKITFIVFLLYIGVRMIGVFD